MPIEIKPKNSSLLIPYFLFDSTDDKTSKYKTTGNIQHHAQQFQKEQRAK